MRALFFLIALTVLSFGQTKVLTMPNYFGHIDIYSDGGDLKEFTTADTSSSFDIRNSFGSKVLVMQFQQGSVAGDSSMTIGLQLYFPFLDNDQNHASGNEGWLDAYNISESAVNSKFVEIPSSIVNSSTEVQTYLILSNYNDTVWAPAERARIVFRVGTGDLAKVKFTVVGQ
jgi:hypothetical protein